MLVAGPAWCQEAVDRARRHMDDGQYRTAVIELKSRLQQDPGDASARLLLGELYLRLKDGAGAEKELLRAEKLGADPEEWRVNLIKALLLQGRHAEALDRLDESDLPPEQEDSPTLALRGRAHLGLKSFADADRYFDAALGLDPYNRDAAFGKILLQVAVKDVEEATATADELLARFPDDVDALMVRAELHRMHGEAAEAGQRFGQVLKLEPENVRALLGHAMSMIAVDDMASAKADLGRVDEIRNDSAMAHYLRGLVAFKEKERDTAKEHLEKVLTASPDHLQSQYLLGVIGYSTGEYQIAREYLENVVRVMPDNVPALKILAATRIKLHQPEQAIAVLEPLVGNAQDDQAMALLGSAYMLAGDQEQGQEWFIKAVEASPEVAALRTELAITLLAGGETDKAITELRSAVDLGQDTLQADVLLVLAHLKNKEPDQALEASEALKRRMPDSPIAHNLTGLALLAKGDGQEARAQFRKALDLDPEFVTAALNLARADHGEGNLDAAKQGFEEVLERDPTQIDAMLGMARLARQRDDTPGMIDWLNKAQDASPLSPEPGLRLVEHYMAAGETEQASSVATNLARSFPGNVQALLALAQVQSLSGKQSEAVQTLEQMVKLKPADPRLHFLLGQARSKADDLFGAEKALREAISLQPDYAMAKEALAGVVARSGRVGDALMIARELQRDLPNAAIGFRLEGGLHMSEQRSDEALTAFKTAYSKEPTGRMARLLARAHAEADQIAQSISVLEGWLAGQPEDVDALEMLAMNYQLVGRDRDATTAYEELVEKDPTKAIALNNLAWLYHGEGDSRALETAKKAYELSPDRPEIADTYGWVMVQNGKVTEGLTILQQAYLGSPAHTEIGYHVAVGLSMADRKGEAIRVLRRLLRENPGAAQAEDAKALLDKLEE